jgi:replicative DNA helicase
MNAPIDHYQLWNDGISEIEIALIGGVILHPGAIGRVLLTGLEAHHFNEPGCIALWQRIADIVMRGGAIDHRSVVQGGAAIVAGEGANPGAFLARIMASACNQGSMVEYASIIKSAWVIRNLVDAADAARSEAASSDAVSLARKLVDTVDTLRDGAFDRAGSTRGTVKAIADMVGREAQEMIQGLRERPPASGWSDLDKHLPMGGLAPGSLIILAGRTGAGKTMMSAALSAQVAYGGKGVVYFSLEVPSREIATRVVCSRMRGKGPSYGDVLSGRLTTGDLEAFMLTSEEVNGVPLSIEDAPAMGIQDISLAAKKEAAKLERDGVKLGLIVIDHAQIVKPTSRYQGNRVGELGEVANAAKVMAKQLGCAVVLCSQLNRGVEGREDKRPQLQDLRASGEVEEAADAVLMLYREAYYLARSPEYLASDPTALDKMDVVRNQLEVGVEKSRQGSTGRCTLWCDPARSIVTGWHGGR